jgi:hypothetical protein
MTEERARYYARALAQSILRRAQQRRPLSGSPIPSEGYEIVVTVTPPA